MRHLLTKLVPITLLVLLCWNNPAAAQTGGGYDLTWSTIDSGGGETSGGGFTLNGTVGQPDAAGLLEGGSYSLNGGFWLPNSSVATAIDLTANLNASQTDNTPFVLIGIVALILALLSFRMLNQHPSIESAEENHAA